MKLSTRVLLGIFLIVGLAAFFLMHTFVQEVKPGVRQGMEVALADTAHLLAELASEDLKAGTLPEGRFAKAVEGYRGRDARARIWGLTREGGDLRVYVTDARGIVVFDSAGEAVGHDYARWNDVYLTLRGQYGARSTRTNPLDESSSIMYVGAPILDGERIVGVLSVAKPTLSVLPFADRSRRKVLRAGLILMGAALLIGLLLSLWMARAIGRLQRYARGVAEGRRMSMPSLGGGELTELGAALETMRERLEGRQYVERYVHALTHEMKSPLAAIHGATELLGGEIPEADRLRFLENIREQEERLQRLVERMLVLATVERRQTLKDPAQIPLAPMVDAVLKAKVAAGAQRRLKLDNQVAGDASVWGEAFLLEQALSSLIDNAMDFSPAGGCVTVSLERGAGTLGLTVRDDGPGIPEYAVGRVFEAFYSLPRPHSQKKSTGLGLSFVSEVAQLHDGSAELVNRPGGGALARLTLPAK